MSERWRDVPGYEGMYQISDEGRLRSFLPQRNRPISEPVVLKPHIAQQHGYPMYLLSKDGKEKWRTAHSLVAEAFIGPRPNGFECCHNDGDRQNCRLGNLRYDTPSGNMRDRIKHGTLKTRKNGHHWTKIPECEIPRIVDGDEPATSLAARYGVQHSAISQIRRRSGKWVRHGKKLRRREALLALGERVNL